MREPSRAGEAGHHQRNVSRRMKTATLKTGRRGQTVRQTLDDDHLTDDVDDQPDLDDPLDTVDEDDDAPD